MKELKRSINRVQVVGNLEEMNIKEEFREAKISKVIDGNRIEKTVSCNVIGKAEFRNPAFTVNTNGDVIGIEYFGLNFGVAEKALDDNGNIVDNDRYKALKTIMEKFNPRIGGNSNEEPTRVRVDGSVSLNEYASTTKKADGEFYSYQEVTAFAISSSNVSEEDSADAEISGVIKSIAHETRNDEETGRLNVELISFGYNGVAEPFKFVVEADLASDFEDYYELGASVKICFEIKTRQVGTVRVASSGGFGRREAKITSGYKVMEWSVFKGDEPYEEESEYFVDVDTVKNALQEREIMIENRIKDAVERVNTSSASKSPSGASKGKSNNPFGASSGSARKNPFA